MSNCPQCEHHKETARMWRQEANKKPWIGLMDEEIQEIRIKTFDAVATNLEAYRAIEAKLKEKNT
jgi:hypothetical protein